MLRMIRKRILLLILVFQLFPPALNATHIVGGELNYRYLGNDLYEVRLTVYRDCYNGIPPFDNPASLGIFDAFNNFFEEVLLDFRGSDTIPPTINSPCFIPPTNICYERTTYIDTVMLPPSAQGYQMAYQRCCRNYTIVNIILPDATGATYYASVPGTSTFSQNANPVFNNWPPPFICAGIPFVFDHSATDPDGDSIVYELCSPMQGADTINPIPAPPNPPPYSSVIYQAPYSLANLLGGTPLTINPQTGELTALPSTVGQFVVGVCAREFRNGIYLSTTRRDFQLNVVPCPTLVVAALQYPLVTCGSNTVQFVNQSINAGSYLWDFGLPGNSDTSTAFSPVFTYPDTGTYQVSLIAYSFVNPACADTITGQVTVLPEFTGGFLYTKDTCTNEYFFTDTSWTNVGDISGWEWNFGDGTVSADSAPSHFYNAGTYNVILVVHSSRGCSDTIQKALNVLPLLGSSIQSTDARCFGECNGILTVVPSGGSSPYQYQWNDPLNQNTQSADSLCTGTYQVLITDDNGCTFIQQGIIDEPDSLLLSAAVTPAYCGGNCIGSGTASPTGGNGGYSFLWSDPQQQTTATAGGLCQGNYSVTVTDQRGCTATAQIVVVYSDSVPVIEATADTNFIYQGQSTTLHAIPSAGNSIIWNPSGTLNSATSADPVATPSVTTTYQVIITDVNQCTNSDTVTIYVDEVLCLEPELFVPNAFSPDNDGYNDIFRIRGNTLRSVHLEIYDRWGERMFESDDLNRGWDGNFKGKPASPGVYVYHLKAFCYNNREFVKKGNITLLR